MIWHRFQSTMMWHSSASPMPREPFYPIKKDAYLFPTQALRAGDQQQPEEAVRQWCAYELIRAHGVRIDELEFERSVRIGSKTYRIDLLVVRRDQPWIVVECKEPNHAKPAEGMAQAISYADAQGVQAPFAVYTNGHLWHVQRRVRGQWLAVPDLPRQPNGLTGEPLTEILRAFKAMAPLLHKLDEPLSGAEAEKYLSAMQVFFCGNLLTDGIDRELRFGTDNLLRVLAGGAEHRDYRLGKLAVARKAFESYRERAALGVELAPILGDLSVAGNSNQLHASLMHLIGGAQGNGSLDFLLLRLNVALLEYGMHQDPTKNPYPALLPNLHCAVRDFLDAALAIHLNNQLPDSLDRISVDDMRSYCQLAWDQLKAE